MALLFFLHLIDHIADACAHRAADRRPTGNTSSGDHGDGSPAAAPIVPPLSTR